MRRLILLLLLGIGFCLQSNAGQAGPVVRPGMIRPLLQGLQGGGKPGGGPGGQAAGPSVDYELTAADAVRVRMKDLPVEFDDKGHLKKFTPDELKKKKGDTADEQKLSGYKSEFNVLKPGDVIQVSLSKLNKDKEAKGGAAGNYVGIIVDMSDKVITLRVHPNGPVPRAMAAPEGRGGQGGGKNPENRPAPPGGKGAEGRPGGAGPAANRVVISADKSQASTIVIIEQAPEPEAKRGKEREKNK